MPAHDHLVEVLAFLGAFTLDHALDQPSRLDRVDSLVADYNRTENTQEKTPFAFRQLGKDQHFSSGQTLLSDSQEGES